MLHEAFCRRLGFGIGHLLAGLVVSASAGAGEIRSQLVGVGMLPGDPVSRAVGINNQDQLIFNTANKWDTENKPWLYSDGTLTNLAPNGFGSVAAINDSGQLAGYGLSHGTEGNRINDQGTVIWGDQIKVGDQWASIGSLGGGGTGTTDINNVGQVVGTSKTADGKERPFVYENGQMLELLPGLPEGNDFFPVANNDLGQVVGFTSHGLVLYSYDGELHPLGSLGGSWATAHDINNHGWIVGESHLPDGDYWLTHAFLDIDGTMLDLNNLIPSDSGLILTDAVGINDNGWIIAEGYNRKYQHAFLLMPVPEPTSILIVGAGFLLAAGCRARMAGLKRR